MTVIRYLGALALLGAGAGAAQPPIEFPRVTDSLPCQAEGEGEGAGAGEEVVVCGRRVPRQPYRLDPQFREPPLDQRSYSWAARMRDESSIARFEDQVTGPSGALNRNRQIDCQWRAERQEIAGQMPDCTLQVRKLPGQR